METVTFEGEHDLVLGSGFASSSSLKTVVLPEGLTEIGSQAFYGSSVESVTIPSTVTVIGANAFQSCSSLREVIIEGTSLVEIGDGAFNYCTSLESINLPDSITIIGEQAFERCSALTEITLPESLTTLGTGAFLTAGLTDIYMPEGMELEKYDATSSLNTDATTTVHVVSGSWANEQQSVWEEMGHTVSVE
ncbi:MAG: leucine-rich repeat domain-containing protein [Clostridiales bacterium]|nr:leucine-rich repeat domain-containing protein [Clostridiales bacterium]